MAGFVEHAVTWFVLDPFNGSFGGQLSDDNSVVRWRVGSVRGGGDPPVSAVGLHRVQDRLVSGVTQDFEAVDLSMSAVAGSKLDSQSSHMSCPSADAEKFAVNPSVRSPWTVSSTVRPQRTGLLGTGRIKRRTHQLHC